MNNAISMLNWIASSQNIFWKIIFYCFKRFVFSFLSFFSARYSSSFCFPTPLFREAGITFRQSRFPHDCIFCCFDNCFLKHADEPAHILIMINFFCIPILSLHKVYLHEQYGKESTHKEIYRT